MIELVLNSGKKVSDYCLLNKQETFEILGSEISSETYTEIPKIRFGSRTYRTRLMDLIDWMKKSGFTTRLSEIGVIDECVSYDSALIDEIKKCSTRTCTDENIQRCVRRCGASFKTNDSIEHMCNLCDIQSKRYGIYGDVDQKYHPQIVEKFKKVEGMIDGLRIKSFVYFIGDGEYIKIGQASNPIARLKELQTGNGRELILLLTIPTFACGRYGSDQANAIERFLHLAFKEYRLAGEWFDITKKINISEWNGFFGCLTKCGNAAGQEYNRIKKSRRLTR